MTGLVRVFARVTDGHGAMACTPPSEAVAISDPPQEFRKRLTHELPAFDYGARVKEKAVVAIDPNAAPGQPVATLAAGVPVREVGRGGYLLWNWRQQKPAEALKTGEVATPTKRVLAPFVDAFRPDAFTGAYPWPPQNRGGLLSFSINGTGDDLDAQGRSWHGSVPVDTGQDEVTVKATDDQPHRLTLVMPASPREGANVRVSVIGAGGATETVVYRHSNLADQILQFRFRGEVTLRVQVTARPPQPISLIGTQIGPSALFLD